jgi:uncharacterized repeat protein (TIGR01451 family)
MDWRAAPLGLALALLASPARAEDAPRLRVDLQVEREVVEQPPSGPPRTRREAVDAVAVGDVLVYTLAVVNEGSSPALEARFVDPVPDGTVLIPESVEGPGEVTYSIDGGTTFAPYPITRRVVAPDGSERDVPVPPEAYTHVRWTLTEPLDPGQVRTANFKVRVE